MKKPMVYYSVSVFLGCISTRVLFINTFLGAVFAASFLSIMYFTNVKKIFFIIAAFFMTGVISFHMYYNFVPDTGGYIGIRIIDKNNYNVLATHKGRKLHLTGDFKNINNGQHLIVRGRFEKTPDYNRGVIGTLAITEVTGSKDDIIWKLSVLRTDIFEQFKTFMGEEKAAIVASASFGDTAYLPSEISKDYKLLGIVHVVSVSGLHMSLIYKAAETFCGSIPALLFSFIYVIFTGGKSPTIRAYIMIAVLKLSKKIYRKYDSLSALGLSAIILLLWRPYYSTDVGFALSFLSVLGIILHYKKLQRFFYRLPKFLNEGISLTLSAQFYSAPYAVLHYYSFSPGFLLGNLMLLPVYSLIVILGNVSALLYSSQFLFRISCSILELFLIAAQGGREVLTGLAPPLIYFNYTKVVIFFVFYMSYIFYKYGKKKYVFLPLFTVILLFFDSYKLIPEIRYVQDYGNGGVVVKYKHKSALIMSNSVSEKRRMDLMVKYNVKSFETAAKGNCRIVLNKDFFVIISKPLISDNKALLNTEINRGNKKVLIATKDGLSQDEVYRNYDIIFLDSKVKKQKGYDRELKLPVLYLFPNRIYIS
jgi:competence protein ComEC